MGGQGPRQNLGIRRRERRRGNGGEWEGEWEGMGANESAVIQRHTERMREEGDLKRRIFLIMQQEMQQRVANLAKRM